MGHSQGGHAALFTASLAPAWAPDLALIGVVALAPLGGAHEMIAGLGNIRTPVSALGFLALILMGAAAADRAVRLGRMLTPAALRLLARAETTGIDDLLVPGPPPLLVPGEMFRPGTDLSPLLKVLAANDPAKLRLRVPALIVQGDDDLLVARPGTDLIVSSLNASGAMPAYHSYPGAGHFDLIETAHADNAQWIDTCWPTQPACERSSLSW